MSFDLSECRGAYWELPVDDIYPVECKACNGWGKIYVDDNTGKTQTLDKPCRFEEYSEETCTICRGEGEYYEDID